MKNSLLIILSCCALWSSTAYTALSENETRNQATVFRDDFSQDFIVVSEKSDGRTEIWHIDQDSYDDAIKELKLQGTVSVCS